MIPIYKEVLLNRWDKEARFNQGTMVKLCWEMWEIDWWDADIWTKLATDVCSKKKVFNIHDYDEFLNGFVEANENP